MREQSRHDSRRSVTLRPLQLPTAFTTGSERYLRFAPTQSGSVTARLTQATPELSIAVLRGAPDGSCAVDDCVGFGTEVTFTVTAGETYFLVVDAPDGEDGSHVVELDCMSL